MKEASGELSMTAITVVAIAAIAGVFTMIIYPRIRANIIAQADCTAKFNCGQCDGGTQTCSAMTEDGNGTRSIVCPCEEAAE